MDKMLTEQEAKSLAESLKELLQRLRSDKIALEERIAQVKANLDLIQSGNEKETLFGNSKPRKKRPYGQNPKKIKGFLNSHPNESFKSDQIAHQLNIARSSTYATLKRLEKKGKVELVDGLWRKKLTVR